MVATVNFEMAGVPSVNPDHYQGGRLATEHLLASGRRKLAHLNTGEGGHWAEIRRAYEDSLKAARRKLSAHPILISPRGCGLIDSGRELTEMLWQNQGPADGIFAGNDLMAVGALQYLQTIGVRVPDEVQLVGFDDIELAAITQPPLTTIAVDRVGLGRQSVQCLRREGGGADRNVLDVSLMVRSSTGATVPI